MYCSLGSHSVLTIYVAVYLFVDYCFSVLSVIVCQKPEYPQVKIKLVEVEGVEPSSKTTIF